MIQFGTDGWRAIIAEDFIVRPIAIFPIANIKLTSTDIPAIFSFIFPLYFLVIIVSHLGHFL